MSTIHLEPYKNQISIYKQGEKYILTIQPETRIILTKKHLIKIHDLVKKHLEGGDQLESRKDSQKPKEGLQEGSS